MNQKLKDIFQYSLAAIIIIGWFYLFNMIFTHTIPQGNEAMANQMFGALTMAVAGVIAYFFGTNKESSTKTDMLFRSTPTIVPTTSQTETTTKTDSQVTKPENVKV